MIIYIYLFIRSIKRGLDEGRFLQCEGPHGLYTKAVNSLDDAKSLINDKIIKDYMIYNANFEESIFNKFKCIFNQKCEEDKDSITVYDKIDALPAL